ncbi:MAG: hypothetical protein HY040_16475 [Planctomycetes bacterium]|nr:hypothetical protein [Planctomycetota bacterium]
MKKLVLISIGLLAVAALTLVGFPWAAAPQHRITYETYEKLRPRMSREEVFDLIGPPGDYRSGKVSESQVELRLSATSFNNPLGGYEAQWLTDDVQIGVNFDEKGRVSTFGYTGPAPETFLEKLCRWLQLPW